MDIHPSVLKPGPHDEGKMGVITVELHLETRGQVSLQYQQALQMARQNGTTQSLAGCKGHIKGTKTDKQVRSTGYEKPVLQLSMSTSSVGKGLGGKI